PSRFDCASFRQISRNSVVLAFHSRLANLSSRLSVNQSCLRGDANECGSSSYIQSIPFRTSVHVVTRCFWFRDRLRFCLPVSLRSPRSPLHALVNDGYCQFDGRSPNSPGKCPHNCCCTLIFFNPPP